MALSGIYQCEDFMQFQSALKEMRLVDDKIIYALNSVIPTESFRGQVDASDKCRDLYRQLTDTYGGREKAVKNCISSIGHKIDELKAQKKSAYSVDIDIELKKKQTQLRLLQSELNVENVIKTNTIKTYNERCRNYHKIPSQ